MRFCEAEYNAPSVVSHHENPASEPSVFWSAGCPSFARCCESHCARLANAKEEYEEENQGTRVRERRPRLLLQRMRPRSRIANLLNVGSKVTFPKYPS